MSVTPAYAPADSAGVCLYIQLIHRDSDDAVHFHVVHLVKPTLQIRCSANLWCLKIKLLFIAPGHREIKIECVATQLDIAEWDACVNYSVMDEGKLGCCFTSSIRWSFILLFLFVCAFACAVNTFVFPDPSIQCLCWKYRAFYSWLFEKTCHESFRVTCAVYFKEDDQCEQPYL